MATIPKMTTVIAKNRIVIVTKGMCVCVCVCVCVCMCVCMCLCVCVCDIYGCVYVCVCDDARLKDDIQENF